jgi:hypothetical protein
MLKPKQHRIVVETEKGKYVGSLPDDISHHLTKFLVAGAEYSAVVQSVSKRDCNLFIKEVSKPSKYAHLCSFPLPSNRTTFSDSEEELLIESNTYELEMPDTDEEDQPIHRGESYEDLADQTFV